MVCDTKGYLSIAGVMGGAETEVTEKTRNVLLEGAAWNFINIRKTLKAQNFSSEAAYRFSRGIHPAMAPRGVTRGLELMRQWSGGVVNEGLIDKYPLPAKPSVVEIEPADAMRWLGVKLTTSQLATILRKLEFSVKTKGKKLLVTSPDHRLDIGEGVIGKADLMEEVARIYGYEKIAATRMRDQIPPQQTNRTLELEERIRDLLTRAGLQEVITYRMTTGEQEARRLPEGSPPDDKPYIRLQNPISQDRVVMRKSLLASVLEIMERNANLRERVAIFEIGPIFHASEAGPLPDELPRLVIALSGSRGLANWDDAENKPFDFYDMKGTVGNLLRDMGLRDLVFEVGEHPSFHPGKCSKVMMAGRQLGVFGELHPQVHAQYDFGNQPVMAAKVNLDVLYELVPERFDSLPVPTYPPVLEDLAFIIDEAVSADTVDSLIRQTGGKLLTALVLFDLYRSEQIGKGKKSLAYQLTYQHPDRTLTDDEVAKLRERIVQRLEQELGAQLRG
jgi:phenylalanyl-tRNA synthetase beta chain